MKKDVYISIKGLQELDGEKDNIEITTEGRFYNKDGKYYISYNEGELSGLEKCSTTLKIAPDGIVTMMRRGHTNTHLVFEKGRCHTGHYETPYGDFTISVTAKKMNVDIDDNGGNIDIDYVLNINNIAQTHNGISLKVHC